uniref:Triple QxxK/R motif-containing protein n=1 Tax=Oncorhynchus kisutch TaxID=8019 RepID=A0A8C7DLG7_ONCKI
MGRKDACAAMAPVDQYRKQIGKQDYKKTKSALKLTKLKAEAKKSAPGIRVCMSHPPSYPPLLSVMKWFYAHWSQTHTHTV